MLTVGDGQLRTGKIDELREVVTKLNELKDGLERMGIEVRRFLELTDE